MMAFVLLMIFLAVFVCERLLRNTCTSFGRLVCVARSQTHGRYDDDDDGWLTGPVIVSCVCRFDMVRC